MYPFIKSNPKELTLVLTFLILSLVGVFHHELSLDEARVWLSMSEIDFGSIINQTGCEMHCLPWFYAVKTMTSVTSNPVIMQIFSVILGTFVFSLISFFSPFGLVEKILLLVNYYILFEFNIIARPYVLMTLGLFLVCLSFPRRLEKPVPFLLALLLLQNSTYFGIFLSIPFMALHLYESRKGLPLILIYLFFLVWYSLPFTKEYNCFHLTFSDLNLSFSSFVNALWDVSRAFFIITTNTWNEHLGDTHSWIKNILVVFWPIFILVHAWVLRKRPKILFLLFSGVGIIFAYRFLKPIYYGNFFRHMGVLPVFYISCLWIFREELKDRSSRLLLWGVLLCGAYSGMKIYAEDIDRNFSNGISVHKFINQSEFKEYSIIPDSMLFTSSYLVYSDRMFFNHLEGRDQRYFSLKIKPKHTPITGAVVRGIHIVVRIPEDDLLRVIRNRAEESSHPLLVIVNYPLSTEFIQKGNLRLLNHFEGAINATEDYFVFLRERD